MHAPSSPEVSIVRPALFAVLVCAFYVAAILPLLSHHKFDTSVLILAGKEFVDPGRTLSPVAVRPHSGYDGQFYYRLAVDPFSLARDAYGVRIDNVPWRAQRILYPLIVHAVALGRPEWVPPALMIVNLAGLAVIGFFAARLGQRVGSRWGLPATIALWPGLILTLGRDTTEIVAAAFLLAAIDSYLARRLGLYALFAALAVLARETCLIFLLGVFAFEAWTALRRREFPIRALWCALPPLVYAMWRGLLFLLTQQSLLGTQLLNMDWPLVGYAKALRTLSGLSPHGMLAIACLLFLLGWIALVTLRLVREPIAGGLAVGWMALAALMLCLASGGGPLVEPIATFRAFTECFMIGAVLLVRSSFWRPLAIAPCVALLWYGAWRHMMGTNW